MPIGLRHKVLQRAATVAFCVALGCPGAKADDTPSYSLAYGLDRIVAHKADPDLVTVTVTPVTVKDRLLYVADFYGDGLLYFTLSKTKDIKDGEVRLSLKAIDAILSGAALGSLAQVGRIRAEKDAIVLEASEKLMTVENAERAQTKKLTFYRHNWVMPQRKVLKKSRSKAQSAALLVASRLSDD